jgi:hypothetical protein
LGKLTEPTQDPYKIIDVQQLPINGTILIQQSLTSVEHVNICQLLPFFECYNWGCECHTSVIMTLWPIHTLMHDVTTKYPKPAKSQRLICCTLSTLTKIQVITAHANHLRKSSHFLHQYMSPFAILLSVLFYKEGLYISRQHSSKHWCGSLFTSLPHHHLVRVEVITSILAHSSTLHYLSTFCHHRTQLTSFE